MRPDIAAAPDQRRPRPYGPARPNTGPLPRRRQLALETVAVPRPRQNTCRRTAAPKVTPSPSLEGRAGVEIFAVARVLVAARLDSLKLAETSRLADHRRLASLPRRRALNPCPVRLPA